jgi:hypothetical protein
MACSSGRPGLSGETSRRTAAELASSIDVLRTYVLHLKYRKCLPDRALEYRNYRMVGSVYAQGEEVAELVEVALNDLLRTFRGSIEDLSLPPLFGPQGVLPLVPDEDQMETSGIRRRLAEIGQIVGELRKDMELLGADVAAWSSPSGSG